MSQVRERWGRRAEGLLSLLPSFLFWYFELALCRAWSPAAFLARHRQWGVAFGGGEDATLLFAEAETGVHCRAGNGSGGTTRVLVSGVGFEESGERRRQFQDTKSW